LLRFFPWWPPLLFLVRKLMLSVACLQNNAALRGRR
jgi:hypothetical protein